MMWLANWRGVWPVTVVAVAVFIDLACAVHRWVANG
jgi:hypothetical protein